ncbi:MAG: hypothetical protein HRU04_24115 [Oceanospirillaceae bacterium]|nr:hypothetical protein [Oceanospirillaceae bacterium]
MIEFESKKYIYQLCIVVSLLLGMNIYLAFIKYNNIAFIPGLLQLLILGLLFFRSKYAKWAISAWAVLVFIGGAAGLVNIITGIQLNGIEKLPYWNLLFRLVMVSYSIYVLKGMKSIALKNNDSTSLNCSKDSA